MDRKANPYRLLSDLPYNRNEDPLGYEGLARQLRDLILDSKDSTPLVLGIQGGWGVGKSSLMEMLQRQLTEAERRTIEFNAWSYEDRDITEGLIKTILGGLDDDNLIRKVLLRQKWTKRAMIFLRLSTILAATHFIGAGKAVDQAWEAFTKDTEMNNQFRQLFEKVMERWAEKSEQRRDEKRLLVAFIDDLDRCGADRVMRILEAIKLYLGVRNVVFVVGYDRAPIVARIEPQIGKSEFVTGSQYMEKIIQVPFTIPPPDDVGLKRYLHRCLEDCGAGSEFEGLEDVIISGNEENPRKIKLFINTFIIRYSICSQDEEIDPACLCRILLMELYFPEFYRRHLRRDTNRIQMLADFVDISDTLEAHEGSFGDLPPEIQDALKRNERDEASFDKNDDVPKIIRDMTAIFPEDFEGFAKDRQLVTLVKSLASELETKDEELRQKALENVLKLSELTNVTQQRKVRGDFAATLGRRTARILWVDDHPDNKDWIREKMIPASIGNVLAKTTGRAISMLNRERFDLVISDISRQGDCTAGFDMAERIRQEVERPVKIIFYTGRVTQQRRTRAEELDAHITSVPEELVAMIIGELGEVVLKGQKQTPTGGE